MDVKHVRDVMIGLDKVPKVHQGETLYEAVHALDVSQEKRPGGRLPYRVVLVYDDDGNIVGKLGHLAFLSAMEPGYESPGCLSAMERAGVDPELVESMKGLLRLLGSEFATCCRRASYIPVRDVMRPLHDWVDEDLPLISAVSKMVKLQTLSVPVHSGEHIAGLLRLADLFDVIADVISHDRHDDTENDKERGDDVQGSSG